MAAPNRRVLVGVSLVCFANLLLEIVLTRIFSATMFYHFTFLAIALALFGLGASGVYVYVNPTRFTVDTVHEDMGRYARRFALGSLVALVYILANPIEILPTAGSRLPEFTNRTWMQLVLLSGATALPFFYAGLVVALAVTHYRRHIDQLYFYDLCGAAAAALCVSVLLTWFGGPSLVVAIALCAAGAAMLLAPRSSRRFGLAAALALLLLVNLLRGIISVPSAKFVVASQVVFEQWNAFSRVTVEKFRPGELDIKIDSFASTRITNLSEGADWKTDISSLAYAMFATPPKRSVVIGPGGGRDVSHALAAGTLSVTGVEVNPIIADAVMRRAFVEKNQDLYRDPRVNVVVDEGRSFVRRSPDRFDVIQASLVDTWAATAAGAFALTENTLYTVEAFDEYYEHLTDEGAITMTRWYTGATGETARLVLVAAGALEQRGVATNEIRDHLYLAIDKSSGAPLLHATLLAKRTPFTADELARLDAACGAGPFTVVLAPHRAGTDDAGLLLGEMVAAGAWSERVKSVHENLLPPTDDQPFFFYGTKPRDLFRVDRLLRGEEQLGNPALWVLLAFGAAIVTLAVAFILVPLFLHDRRNPTRARARSRPAARAAGLTYFGLIGLAFITVEIALMQKLTLLLGHPSYALIVVLFGLLVGTAAGARLSGRVSDARRVLAIVAVGVALVVVCLIDALALGSLLHGAVAWALPARILLAAVLVAVCGLPMGCMLPTGVRLASDCDPEMVPWGWGINGATSVIGTVGATILAIHAGFTATLISGAGLYGLAAGAGWMFGRLASAVPRRDEQHEDAAAITTEPPLKDEPRSRRYYILVLVAGALLGMGGATVLRRPVPTSGDSPGDGRARSFLNFDPESTPPGALRDGWAGFEHNERHDSFVWCAAKRCTLAVDLQGQHDRLLRVRLWAFRYPGAPVQSATVSVNGAAVGAHVVAGEPEVWEVHVRNGAWVQGQNLVQFEFAYAEPPAGHVPDNDDPRPLAASFDWLEIAAP